MFSFSIGALGLPLGKTTVMHLVPRDNLPEPNSQGEQTLLRFIVSSTDDEKEIRAAEIEEKCGKRRKGREIGIEESIDPLRNTGAVFLWARAKKTFWHFVDISRINIFSFKINDNFEMDVEGEVQKKKRKVYDT